MDNYFVLNAQFRANKQLLHVPDIKPWYCNGRCSNHWASEYNKNDLHSELRKHSKINIQSLHLNHGVVFLKKSQKTADNCLQIEETSVVLSIPSCT